MIQSDLTLEAKKMLADYLRLPNFTANVACPYFNNRHIRLRGALRVLIGKGSPEEISEEAQLFALREKINLTNFETETLKKFLVDHRLGADCSGFAYHLLEAESLGKKLGNLKKHLQRPFIKSPVRKFLAWLRPIENTGVGTLVHEKNSHEIKNENIQAGDMIIFLKTGLKHDYNHVLVVASVEGENNTPTTVNYAHSFQWSKDGKYDHGVRLGRITIADIKKPLLEAAWEEKNETGNNNETFTHAKNAEVLVLKRLNWFK